ncbi:short-chain dehydrogenase [Oceanobacillus profundus]|uniref:Short-chain dehydrogenase n=1 Tax=Oceanobacillus profundus TaxID=372463 RepID=A0A417YNE8_9BACI|nr:short-chain dehydrogenase [Oceanobacillus profundus]RHW35342.1 short-chain dehydrogenase [Oceanobacillus profundus]
MKHALVVGGTGMLADVSLWLMDQGYHVSVIARNSGRMQQLMERADFKEKITPIIVDYRSDHELQSKVHTAIEQNGDIELVVAWIHLNAPAALKIITREISTHTVDWQLFHVLGSSTDIDKIKREVSVPQGCFYYQIRLGFVLKDEYSRWLTNKEISSGVIDALKQKDSIRTIGIIDPWEKRP